MLCIVYNHEAGVILPAVNGTTIPSVMITKDAGKYLIEQAENGRGTMTIEPHRLLVSTGDRTAMLTFSSWGSSGLRIVPTLSAPGGMVMSASTSGNNLYEYLSGTSMAAPNAAGAYTIMLQAMRERGVEDRRERAELAKTLLESTATLVKNEMGVPVSLRQQGAGVIDISAALESKAVLKEPLLELGDSENGRFTMDLTVKNLSEKRMAFTIDTTVLTDAYVYSGGSWRSTLSSLDISDRVSISCVPRFSVEAGAERTVTLTLRLDQQLREELREVYPNGFYVEGYISLISDEKERIHATFLGYCGDWEAVPIIEQVDFRDVMDANFEQEAGDEDALASLTVDMGYNFAYLCDEGLDTYDARVLGENPWLVTRSYDERIAMTTAASDALLTRGDRFLVELYTLRNAEHVIMLVADQKTGEIYHVSDQAYLSRSQVSDTLGAALPAARFIWDGTDINGELLPDGTAVDVLFYAWLEDEIRISQAYESNMGDENDEADYRWILKNEFDAYIEWEFSLVIDIEAPVVSCETNEDSGTVTVFINEEQFVAYVSVQDGQGTYLAEEVYADEQAGVQHVLTVAPENGTEETLYITVADYAGNITGYEVDCSTMQAKQCPVAMLNDVENNAWYHEAVDYVIENGLMTADNSLYFTPEGGATRVQLLNILYDLAGNPEMTEVDVELPFGDVRGVEDFLPTLKWAYSNGIVTGYSDAFFGAYAPLLRAQMAAMLYRAAVATGEEPDIMSGAAEVFADADQIPDWAADAVVWAAEQGYLAADEDGCVNPMAIVTRAELAYLMMIFYQGT